MDFGLYEMKIVRNNPSSVKSDPRLTRTNDLSPLGSDLSEVYCIYIYIYISGVGRCQNVWGAHRHIYLCTFGK